MARYKLQSALTLIEIITVIAVITVLAGLVISLSGRIDTAAKEDSTKALMASLDIAMQQFCDFGYEYKHVDLRPLKFPLDCNDFVKPASNHFVNILINEFSTASGATAIQSGIHDPNYSGSEALYFFLDRVPQSRGTLSRINANLITGKDKNGDELTISVNGVIYQLFRITDPWGRPLRYDYYDEDNTDSLPVSTFRKDTAMSFPVITSAGPDGLFGTADDIKNR